MRTIKLVVEYDGTTFAGWQRQANALSVQQVLEEALARIVSHPVSLFSSGRTDAGVHARGMVASFRTEVAHPLSAFREGANRYLPPEIAVVEAAETDFDFNPRFDAVAKLYRYSIYHSTQRSPLMRNSTWNVSRDFDFELLQSAGALFVGEHDFSAYRTSGCAARTTVRRIFSVDLHRDAALVTIDIVGSGFLRNMVRIMVGTMMQVAQGKLPLSHISDTLSLASPVSAGPTAPPHGLCLVKVFYGENKMLDNDWFVTLK